MTPYLLTKRQLAARWHVSVRKIDRLREAGRLRWRDISGGKSRPIVRFSADDIAQFEADALVAEERNEKNQEGNGIIAPSTYTDWDPELVDVLTIPELAAHFGVPEGLLRDSLHNDNFLRLFRVNDRGLVARLPDVQEYLDGARG